MLETEPLIDSVINCAYEVRHHLSYGYLESVYAKALLHELNIRGISAEPEAIIKVNYKGIEAGVFRADLLVDNQLIVELKTCAEIISAHHMQLVNYLKTTGIDNGLIINFGPKGIEVKRKRRVLPQRQ